MKMLVVVGEKGKKISLERYDFKEQIWLQGPETFTRPFRKACHLLNAGEKVYMIAGRAGDWDYYRRLDVFDLKDEKWSRCNDMLEDFIIKRWPAAATLDGDIYVAGGIDKLCEKFDHQSGQWIQIADMNEIREWLGMGVMDKKIYAVGGINIYGYLASVECYSPEMNSWTHIPSMSNSRARPGVTALDEKMYVVGGINRNPLKCVEVFNAIDQKWTRLTDMNVERRNPGVVADSNGLIYVAGGYARKLKYLDSVEVYDPRIDTWTLLPAKMSKGKDHASASIIDWPS